MKVIINNHSEAIVSEAELLTSQKHAMLNLLFNLGYDSTNPPLASLLSRLRGLEEGSVILSPVHWQATHNDAMIIATDKDLNLTESESQRSFQLVADYLAEEQMHLHYYDAGTWLLTASQKPSLQAKPVYQMMNQSLMPALAALDATLYWQKIFTECQMLFAAHSPSSAINGVWIWGGAKLKEAKSISICADERMLPVAQMCSKEVVAYKPSVKLKDFEIVLLDDLSNLSDSHQIELKTIPAQWYWNNTAYTHSEPNWFTRLWRHLTHAH